MLKKLRRIYLVVSLLSTVYMVKTQPDFFEKILNQAVGQVNPELAKQMADDGQVLQPAEAAQVANPVVVPSAALPPPTAVLPPLTALKDSPAPIETAEVDAPVLPAVPNEAAAPLAPPPIPMQQAVAAAAPAVSAFSNREQEIDRAIAAAESSPQSPVTSTGEPVLPKPAVKLDTAVVQYEHRQVTTQFLYLKIRNHTVRFNVDDKLDEKGVSKLIAALRSACVSTLVTESGCDSKKRNTVVADKGFFADVENSEEQELSRAEDADTLWKFTCANESENCLSSPAKFKSFKLSRTKAGIKNLVLARGFESQRARSMAKRRPASANSTSISSFVNIEKVFVTQTRTTTTQIERAGTIR